MFETARCPWIELEDLRVEESNPSVGLTLCFWELTTSLLQLRLNLGKKLAGTVE